MRENGSLGSGAASPYRWWKAWFTAKMRARSRSGRVMAPVVTIAPVGSTTKPLAVSSTGFQVLWMMPMCTPKLSPACRCSISATSTLARASMNTTPGEARSIGVGCLCAAAGEVPTVRKASVTAATSHGRRRCW